MRCFFLLILVCSLCELAVVKAFAQVKQGSQKIGFIDSKSVILQLPETKDAQDKLKLLTEQWKTEIEKIKKELDTKIKDFQSKEILFTEQIKEEKNKEIANLEKRISDYQNEKFAPSGEYFKRQVEIMRPIQDRVFNALTEVAKEEQYDFVFDKSGEILLLISNPRVAFQSSKPTPVAFVETEKIIQQMPEAKTVQAKIQKIGEEWQKEFNEMKKDYEEGLQEYERKKAMMSESDKKKKEESIMKLAQKLQEYQAQKLGRGGELEQKQAELFKPLEEKVLKSVEKVAARNGWSIVLSKGCEEKKIALKPFEVIREGEPLQLIRNARVVLNDSGVTSTALVSPRLSSFNRTDSISLKADSGLTVRFFDGKQKLTSVLKSRSGVLFKSNDMEAIGNVEIKTKDSVKVKTEYIKWYEKEKLVRSPAKVEIIKPTERIKGIGFESDASLQNYKIFRVTGLIEFGEGF
ncbi:hypothetical protein CHS0354_023842 [Potamilus streckersoni]|uniref:OmpH family outer membrane protein n=1 Tax=Potamilus streckersoni TaxID=2493646 RepID=A0AAE0VMI3_9BIVA|nr:hypothetical protein CHS0354_023842 [Potamilus streckersoni]